MKTTTQETVSIPALLIRLSLRDELYLERALIHALGENLPALGALLARVTNECSPISEEGFKAGMGNLRLDECPYCEGTQDDALWRRGWRMAQEKK
jgi:ribosome modulation factor